MTDLEKAISLVRAARFDEALRALDAAAGDPSTRAEALGHRAWLHRGQGRYAEAVRDYEALLEIRPTDDTARVLLADSHRQLGDARRGAQIVVELLQRDPMNRAAVELLLRCQEALGHCETSEYSFNPAEPWRPTNFVIQQLESDPKSFPASVFPPVGRFLYSFARCHRPKLALETGCFIGYSSLCIAQAMEENGFGHLHSFDLFMERPGLESPVIGPCADSLQVARAHAQRAGLSHRVTFHKGDSAPKIREQFGDRTAVFDLAFIDGDHTVRGCLADWREVDRLMQPGGIVLFHDTVPDKSGWVGPGYLIEELRRHAPGEYHAVNIPSPEGYGIGIVQKTGAGTDPGLTPPLGLLLREWLFTRKMQPQNAPPLIEVLRQRE
jgi:predicted O-methyltransferase YrrM